MEREREALGGGRSRPEEWEIPRAQEETDRKFSSEHPDNPALVWMPRAKLRDIELGPIRCSDPGMQRRSSLLWLHGGVIRRGNDR